jgi:hypothetical protein
MSEAIAIGYNDCQNLAMNNVFEELYTVLNSTCKKSNKYFDVMNRQRHTSGSYETALSGNVEVLMLEKN